jgi:hypothetical protein
MQSAKKNSVNLHYTRARIKPFLSPWFWGTSLFVCLFCLFLYGLLEYTTNPELFSRETKGPEMDNEEILNKEITTDNNSEEPATQYNVIKKKLTIEELTNLADIENINSLFQQMELQPVVSAKPAEKSELLGELYYPDILMAYQETQLNPLLGLGQTKSKNDQGNFFQQRLKVENSSSLFRTKSNTQTKRIEVIKPNVQLPGLQDLNSNQQVIREEFIRNRITNTRENLNQNPDISNQLNQANNSNYQSNGTENSGNSNNYLTPNNSSNQGNISNNYVSPYSSSINTGSNVPSLGQNNMGNIPNNPSQYNNYNNSSVNTTPNQNQQIQQSTRNPSGFLSYY